MAPATPAAAAPKRLAPIKQRSKASLAHTIAFNAFFLVAILAVQFWQYPTLVLLLWPEGTPQRNAYYRFHKYLKSYWAKLLVIFTMIYAPSDIILTSDGTVDLSSPEVVERDESGDVKRLRLSYQSVWIGNHQIYADWIYLWNLTQMADIDDSVLIMLKKSLKWAPVVGPAMQFFEFLWMARNWEEDRITLGKDLTRISRRAQHNQDPVTLFVFPEGTLVSKLTRPGSARWAAKLEQDDMKHQIMPRSTGLLFCLRSLASRIPDLELWDMTIGYGGMPGSQPNKPSYGQDYFTIQSIWGGAQPPTGVHIHMRRWRVVSGSGNGGLPVEGQTGGLPTVPIGRLTNAGESKLDLEAKTVEAAGDQQLMEVGIASEEEKKIFDQWLRDRWAEKDALLGRFYDTGKFGSVDAADGGFVVDEAKEVGPRVKGPTVKVPIQLRQTDELVSFFCVMVGFGVIELWAMKLLFSVVWWWMFR